jgi:hypothetical protein
VPNPEVEIPHEPKELEVWIKKYVAATTPEALKLVSTLRIRAADVTDAAKGNAKLVEIARQLRNAKPAISPHADDVDQLGYGSEAFHDILGSHSERLKTIDNWAGGVGTKLACLKVAAALLRCVIVAREQVISGGDKSYHKLPGTEFPSTLAEIKLAQFSKAAIDAWKDAGGSLANAQVRCSPDLPSSG